MKPTLQLKLSQQLKLTPQLQQSIRLLQLSTLELNQEIERIVQENPLLELHDEPDSIIEQEFLGVSSPDTLEADAASRETTSDDAEGIHKENEDNDHESEWLSGHDENSFSYGVYDDDHESQQLEAKPLSLREHLIAQISLSQISDRDRKIVSLLIDSLDDDGYLTQGLDELMEMLPPELGISKDDLHIALEYLQHLDPPGVGARDLQECLLLQLKALPQDVVNRDEAIMVVRDHLKILALHDFNQIRKLLGCDDESLRTIQKLITNLNPKPGTAFSFSNERYIVPDITVTKVDGIWVANLNMDAIPRLSINQLYANILKQKQDDSALALASQLSEAKWLIKNIHQRSSTILKVSSAIVARQQQFFEHGEVAMRPLVLREIAENLNLHESTVSRVTTQKFMYTPRGIFELKYFFGSHVSTDSGGSCSATAIRALIKQFIQNENTRKPLSDNTIASLLEQQGIVVARRTVAKYRESMQIPPANLRKSF